MLAGLISRWTMPCSCAACIAPQICDPMGSSPSAAGGQLFQYAIVSDGATGHGCAPGVRARCYVAAGAASTGSLQSAISTIKCDAADREAPYAILGEHRRTQSGSGLFFAPLLRAQ